MGVKNLWDILESCKKTLPLHHLRNKRVCIDLSCWMVQLHSVNKSHCALKDKVYLRGLFHRLRALIALNCSIILVTDGSIPAIKLSTYRQRLNTRNGTEVVQDETASCKASSLQRNMGSEFSCMIKEAKLLSAALGIPCLDGIEEGEAQCALLDSESLCDGCFTSDSDAFLFGARTVYREICLGDGGYVVCYEMTDIEKKLGFGRNSLIMLAILLGGDYSPGVRGFGPESACHVVRSVNDNVILQKVASEGLSFAKKLKGSRKQADTRKCKNKENELDQEFKLNGTEYGVLSKDQFLNVIDAYLKPKCHSADSDAVQKVLGVYPFQQARFQQICTQFFDWPPEKADEYILPKIAERDLRRFANLRSTSSELGVQLPLDEMPVKCPVSRIVKQRKVQGETHFEVSWGHMDGLSTSIVPADLIESACPEKIGEFEEGKAQAKKPNRKPRAKKSDPKASITENEQNLQDLLLDIEQESGPSQKASSSIISESNRRTCQLRDEEFEERGAQEKKPNDPKRRAKKSEEKASITEIDQKLHDLLIDVELKSDVSQKASSSVKSLSNSQIFQLKDEEMEQDISVSLVPKPNNDNQSVTENEVIDLVSPSSVVPGYSVSKRGNLNVECINIIDLSDSETETTPEHTQKAKDLRLFLASIKDVSDY